MLNVPPLLKRYKYHLAILIATLVYTTLQSKFSPGDFKVYLASADYLIHGRNMYSDRLIWDGQLTNLFSYGPAFPFLMIPFACFSEQVAYILFFLFQIILLMRTFQVIERMLPINKLGLRQRNLWLLFSIACSLRFILHNIEFGQVTMLMLFLCVEGLYQIFYGNKLWGSFLLGLGIHIKLLPIVFVPYLLWRKEFGSAVLCAVFFIAFWFSLIPFGTEGFTRQVFFSWCTAINPLSERLTQDQEKIAFQMQGLQPLLATYLLNSRFEGLGFKTNITTLSTPVFNAVLQLSRFLFIVFTLYFLKGSLFQPYAKGGKGFWQLSYLFLAVTLIFPQQQKYSLLLMTPFFSYIIWWLIGKNGHSNLNQRIVFFGLIFIVLLSTFTSDLFVGLPLNYVFQCLRILTIANIAATFLLAYAKPQGSVHEH